MKKLFLPVLVTAVVAGCAGSDTTDTITSGRITYPSGPVQINPITDEPFQDQKPQAQTGSVYMEEEPVVLAQLSTPNSMNPYIADRQPKVMGAHDDVYIKLEIEQPPQEISPCYGAFMLNNNIQALPKEYQYNGWWLLATLTHIKPPSETYHTTSFYWATQISSTQIAAVPANYTTSIIGNPPVDVKIGTDYAQLPYQWVTHMGYYLGFPRNPDEKCVG